MLNAVTGLVGLLVQCGTFSVVYLLAAPSRGRTLAVLGGAIVAVDGYALGLLALATFGVPWQVSNVIAAIFLSLILMSAALRARLRRPRAALRVLARHVAPSTAIVAALVGVQVLAAALIPELSIDGQLYHGPTLAQILNTGTVWGWLTPNQYMYYTDLTMMGGVNIASFTGATIFDNGVQIPHLLILIFALAYLLRRRFASSWIRLAFSALIVAAPVIWLQPRILYVDLAYGAAVASLIVIIVAVRSVGVLEMSVAAVCAGAILATKPTGILTSGFLVVVWIVVASWRRWGSAPSRGRAIWPPVVTTAIGMLAALGFYVRNLLSFGNPVYPVQAAFGPLKFRGIVDLSVFASGDRGSGLVDPGRVVQYAHSLATGALHGVVKPDYDPRAGGYGYIVLAVAVIAVAILVLQGLWVVTRRGKGIRFLAPWRVQLGTLAIVVGILIIQPSSFDTRYVIGPTSVLLAAVLMSSVVLAPSWIDVVAAAAALAIAAIQITWTESVAYPGLHVAKELRGLTERYQPTTPGNPWGRSENISWLPVSGCHTLALQTSGGVAAWGMTERSLLATLPYGLYGAELCNTVVPMQLAAVEDKSATRDPVPSADFLLLYTEDLARWKGLYPQQSDCWREVGEVPATTDYPQAVTIIRTACG